MHYIYFLKSLRNDKVYTDATNKDPKNRLKEHNAGSNDWSRQNGPFKLVYYKRYYCKKDLLEREKFYKTGFGRNIKRLSFRKIGRLAQTVRALH